MKKILFSILIAGVALAFAGCEKQEAVKAPAGGRVVTITAALEKAPTTKVTTGSQVGKFAWESGDQIGVWVGDAFVPFTLDESTVGAVAGKFTGTVPDGKEIDFAVYPYCENDTYADGKYTSNYSDDWWDYKNAVHLYAPKAGTANEYKFQHLCAYVLVTIKNVRADCKYVYLESPGGSMFIQGGESADLTAEWPKLTGEAAEQCFVKLPEDHSKIVLYIPIISGEWPDGKAFKVKFFQDQDWPKEYGKGDLADEPVINQVGALVTGGVINRGEIVVLPEIVFEGGAASGMSATIEGGLSWLPGAKIGLWDGSAFTEKTVASGGVAVGEFEGDIPAGATAAVSPVAGVTIEGNTLSVAREQVGYTTGALLYGTIGDPASPAYLKSVDFKHLGAVIRVTFKNIPEGTNGIFLECGARPFFYFSGTADLSAENPVISSEDKNEWCFLAVPEHTGAIASWTVDVPILTGAYDTPPWGIKAECYVDCGWSDKTSNKPQSNEIQTTGTINRGDVFNVTLEFEAL